MTRRYILCLCFPWSTAWAVVGDAGGPYEVDAEASVTLDGSGSDAEWRCELSGQPVEFDWDLDNDGSGDSGTPSEFASSTNWSAAGIDGPATFDVGLEVSCWYDSVWWGWVQEVDHDSTTITVDNVDPTITSVTWDPTVLYDGDEATFTVAFTDPEAADTHTITWWWEDGSSDTGTEVTRTFPQWGTGHLTVGVVDDDGGFDTLELELDVLNRPPEILSVSAPAVVDQGDTFALSATAFDTDPIQLRWTLPDGSVLIGADVFAQIDAVGPADIVLEVLDGTSITSEIVSLVVDNVAPTIHDVTVPSPIYEGVPFQLIASASDPVDPITATWTFQDGTVLTGVSAWWGLEVVGDSTVVLEVSDPYTSVSIDVVLTALDTDPLFDGWTGASPPFHEGVSERLEVAVSDPGGLVDYTWDPGDGRAPIVTDDPWIDLVWPDNGIFTLSVTAADDEGSTVDAVRQIGVRNVAPSIDVIDLPENPLEGSNLTFAVQVSDVPADAVAVSWDFGDGGTATGAQTTHIFTGDGSFNGFVSAVDEDGGNTSAAFSLVVGNAPPVLVAADVPDTVAEGQLVLVAASANDPGGDPLTFSWDLGDGTIATGALVNHAWTQLGEVTVTLTVSDDAGANTVHEWIVLVTNSVPVIHAVSAPAEVDEGELFELSVDASDPGNDTLTVTWLVGGVPVAAGAVATISLPDDGAIPVEVAVSDGSGATARSGVVVVVNNVAPSVTVTGDTDDSGGVTLSWTAAFTDPGADTHVVSWDPGDGSGAVVGGTSYAWTFSGNGTFPVTVSVEDDDGGVGSATLAVTISSLGPVVSVLDAPTELDEGTAGDFSCSSDDPSLSWSWDFNDGGTATGAAASHAFGDDGTYDVRCVGTDALGQDGSGVMQVLVNNVAPTLVGVPATVATESANYLFEPGIVDPGLDTHTWQGTLPDGATLGADGAVSWTPAWADLGEHGLELVLTDDDGGEAILAWTVTVSMLDDDLDGMSDLWEGSYGLDPDDPADAAFDPDADGRTNLEEFEAGSDPGVFDGPATPVLVAPVDGDTVSTATPELLIEVDDREDVRVDVAIYADASLSVLLWDATELAPVAGEVSVVTAELPENGEVWWTAGAHDDFVAGPWAPASSFRVDAVAEAPGAPGLAWPQDGASIAELSPALRIDPASDPDGDELTHIVVLRTPAGVLVETSEALLAPASGALSWTPSTELVDGESWCWTAWAVDSGGLEGPEAEASCFVIDLSNLPPSAPVILSPADGEWVTRATPEIRWDNGIDPEDRPTFHYLLLDTSPSYDSVDIQVAEVPSDPSGASSWEPEPLPEDTWMYLRVLASDHAADSDWAELSFFVDTVNGPPQAPVLFHPEDGAPIAVDGQLTVVNTTDPESEAVVYVFTLVGPEGTETASVDVDEDPSGYTSWSPGELSPGTWTWTAEAVDARGASSGTATPRTLLVEGSVDDTPNTRIPDDPEVVDPEDPKPGGCACNTGGSSPWWVLLTLCLARRRRIS